jgi:predicted deacylase
MLRVLMSNTFRIGPMNVEKGSKRTGFLKVLEYPDGSTVSFPLIIVNGEKEGPTLYLGAAFHGDEVNGIESIRRLINKTDPKELSGKVIAVPIQNPLAFHSGNRLPLNQLIKSPMDNTPANMHDIFPGKKNGNPFEVMVYRLFTEVISKADYAIDMHQPTTGGKYVPITFTPLSGNKSVIEKSEELAKAFGTEYLVKTSKGSYAKRENMHVHSAIQGIPSIMVELGEGGKLEEEYIEIGMEGISNVLKHLGIMKGKPEPTKQITVTEMVQARASRGGILLNEVDLGQKVSEGDLVANIVSPMGPVIEAIKSPVTGIMLRKTTFPTVIPGDLVAAFGI